MHRKITRLIAAAQLSFFACLAICIALRPQFLKAEAGFSNYGVHRIVFIPYSIAFLGCSLLTFAAAHSMQKKNVLQKRFAGTLTLLACLFLLVLFSTYPYRINTTLRDIHIVVSAILFIVELGMSVWLSIYVYRGFVTTLLLFVQLLGFAWAILSLADVVHLLFVGQLLAGLSFGALLIVTSAAAPNLTD
jgi:hypothetical protein